MTGECLMRMLGALTERERQLAVVFEYYTAGDEMENVRVESVDAIQVKKRHYAEQEEVIALSQS